MKEGFPLVLGFLFNSFWVRGETPSSSMMALKDRHWGQEREGVSDSRPPDTGAVSCPRSRVKEAAQRQPCLGGGPAGPSRPPPTATRRSYGGGGAAEAAASRAVRGFTRKGVKHTHPGRLSKQTPHLCRDTKTELNLVLSPTEVVPALRLSKAREHFRSATERARTFSTPRLCFFLP